MNKKLIDDIFSEKEQRDIAREMLKEGRVQNWKICNKIMRIEPLQKKDIKKYNALLRRVFGKDYYADYYSAYSQEYFCEPNWGNRIWQLYVLKDREKIIGTTGFYNYRQNGEVWLSWFCIDKNYRGKRLGEKLLRWTVKKAKKLGFHTLKILTSDRENEHTAQYLYDKIEAVTYRKKRNGIYKDYYKILNLLPLRKKKHYSKPPLTR